MYVVMGHRQAKTMTALALSVAQPWPKPGPLPSKSVYFQPFIVAHDFRHLGHSQEWTLLKFARTYLLHSAPLVRLRGVVGRSFSSMLCDPLALPAQRSDHH